MAACRLTGDREVMAACRLRGDREVMLHMHVGLQGTER